VFVNYLEDDWVHWLPLAEFPYNNGVHVSTGAMPFFAEKSFHPSIEATIWAFLANGLVPDVPDPKAWAEKLVEHWAALSSSGRRSP
jgi:hypothetical protein